MDRPQVSIPPAATVLGTLGTVYAFPTSACQQQYANIGLLSVVGVFRLFHKYGTIIAGRAPKACPEPCSSYGGVPFGVYAIVQNFNFALKFQPQAFASLTLIAWGQTLYYQNKWRAWTATVATIALAGSFGIMELILILTLRGPYERGVEWPMMLMAILASVIQVIGLIPPYFELAKRNGRVIGIDFWFLTIDYAGAFFSLMAIVAQQWFDALGASLYIACMALEAGIFASQAVWLWRVRHIRRAAKKVGKTYDEYVAESTKKIPRSDSTETMVDVEAAREKDTADARSEKTVVATQDSTTGSNAELDDDSTSMTVKQALDALQAPPAATLKASGSG
ncbi:pq loop repeat protein [Pyrenophora tritici-repentis]|nr:pq loop repeat protein [Pyrenophora tritici-repentis]